MNRLLSEILSFGAAAVASAAANASRNRTMAIRPAGRAVSRFKFLLLRRGRVHGVGRAGNPTAAIQPPNRPRAKHAAAEFFSGPATAAAAHEAATPPAVEAGRRS